MRRAAHSSAAAWLSLGLLALNPNLLYLQATPMTETVVLAALMALLYFTVLFRETQSFAAVIGAGVAGHRGFAGSLRRLVRDPVRCAIFPDCRRSKSAVRRAANFRCHRGAWLRFTGSATIGGSIPIRWNSTMGRIPP